MQAHNAYDALRYPGHFYPQSSPDWLATLGTLSGLHTVPVESCRVLELGCGEGGNLITLADRFPGSRFVGIDLSGASIARGQQTIDTLGLQNISLIAQDILAFTAPAGAFDYIIVHGVMSWVPEPVRQHILALCGLCLAPTGLAYLSYDVLPGGHLRNWPRDLMRFHTRNIPDAANKVRAAKEIIEFVGAAIPAGTLERELLKREIGPYEGKDFILYHDLLSDVNDPVYFLDFMDAAAQCGLQFVSEANLHYTRTAEFPEHVRQHLDGLAGRLEREQYLDFIHLRSFRQTILCRQGQRLDLVVKPEQLERLFVSCLSGDGSAAIVPSELCGMLPFGPADTSGGGDPEALAVMLMTVLREVYPRALRFSELRNELGNRLEVGPGLHEVRDAAIAQLLMAFFANDIVRLHTQPLDFNPVVGSHPAMGALARLQAAQGNPVVTARLDVFHLQPGLMRQLALLLDGSRDIEGLLIELAARMSAHGQAIPNPVNVRRALEVFAANALLTR